VNTPLRVIAAIVLMLPFFGCVTGEKMSRLHPGMTKAEVVSVLGRPDGYKEIAGYEVYRYSIGFRVVGPGIVPITTSCSRTTASSSTARAKFVRKATGRS